MVFDLHLADVELHLRRHLLQQKNKITIFDTNSTFAFFQPIFNLSPFLTFKAIHGIAPSYICELINVKEENAYNLRSSKGLLLQPPSITTQRTPGDRAFSAAEPRLWNNLPLDIRNEKSFTRFKCLLKTHLFIIVFH